MRRGDKVNKLVFERRLRKSDHGNGVYVNPSTGDPHCPFCWLQIKAATRAMGVEAEFIQMPLESFPDFNYLCSTCKKIMKIDK
jgi:hypothetical protein